MEEKAIKDMEIDELIEIYRNSGNTKKKEILEDITGTKKFGILMSKLYPAELVQMARIHPSKEAILDTMISDMENHSNPIVSKYISGNSFQRESFEKFKEALHHKSLLERIKDRAKRFITRTPALPDNISKKLDQIEELSKYEVRRTSATGKKMEQLETQDLDQAVDESRVEINNGEMVRVFDRFAKPARAKGFLTEPEVAGNLKTDLKNEYTNILGTEKSDIAELIANQEFESFSGEHFYVPYKGVFGAGTYDRESKTRTDSRSWKKNLLEIEKVENFTVGEQNFGEVFISKSEFSPTSYAIEGKWSPVYEYFTKNENGEFVRIGSGKISKETGKMESIISMDGSDISGLSESEIDRRKEEGTLLQFDASDYLGKSSKTSRKDIEQAITMKSIQEHLGPDKKITDITQIKDMSIFDYDKFGKVDRKNAYIVASIENGKESYEIVCMDDKGKCQPYPGMSEDMFNKQANINFPFGATTGLGPNSLNVLDTKKSLETFKNSEGKQFSVYRDKSGVLRMAEIVPRMNGVGTYAEELDSYSVMHEGIEKAKEETESPEQTKEAQKEQAKESEKGTKSARDGYNTSRAWEEMAKQDINKQHESPVYNSGQILSHRRTKYAIESPANIDCAKYVANRFEDDYAFGLEGEKAELARDFARLEVKGTFGEFENPYTGEITDAHDNPKLLLQMEKVNGLNISELEDIPDIDTSELHQDIYIATYEIEEYDSKLGKNVMKPIKEYYKKSDNGEMEMIGTETEEKATFTIDGVENEVNTRDIKKGRSLENIKQSELVDKVLKDTIEATLSNVEKVTEVAQITDMDFLNDLAKQCGVDENYYLPGRTYIVSTINEKGEESFDIVVRNDMAENCFGTEFEHLSGIEATKESGRDMFTNTGMSLAGGAQILNKTSTLQEFETQSGHRYAISRDKDGKLGFNEIIRDNGKELRAEKVDAYTYSTSNLRGTYERAGINQEDVKNAYNTVDKTKSEKEQTQEQGKNNSEGR